MGGSPSSGTTSCQTEAEVWRAIEEQNLSLATSYIWLQKKQAYYGRSDPGTEQGSCPSKSVRKAFVHKS